MNKNYVIGGLAVVLAVLAVLYFRAPAPQPPFGASSNAFFPMQQLTVNGLTYDYFSSGLNQGSTTLCSFRFPSEASSTLLYAGLNIKGPTTSAISVDIGVSTLPDATTTLVMNNQVVAGGTVTLLQASTTSSGQGLTNAFSGASPYLNFKYGGTRGQLNTLSGTCRAILIEN